MAAAAAVAAAQMAAAAMAAGKRKMIDVSNVFKLFRSFCPILARFGPFWNVFGHFGAFSDVFGCFGTFLDVFRPLAKISGSNCYVSGLTIGQKVRIGRSCKQRILVFFCLHFFCNFCGRSSEKNLPSQPPIETQLIPNRPPMESQSTPN